MNRLSWLARLIIGLTLAFTTQAALAGPTFPELTGRVVDQAAVLSPETEANLTQQLEGLESRTGHQFVVVTVNSLQGLEIEDYGILLGRKWGIGRKNENDGVLLIVAPKQRKVRIEVGYGLESTLTNDEAATIIAQDIVPKFKADDINGGVAAGTEAVIGQIDTPKPAPLASPTAAASPLSSAPASTPFSGSVSVGAAILIALVVALLVRMLGGGKKTQIVYATTPAAAATLAPAMPVAPLIQTTYSLQGEDPAVADNPVNKVMHTTIGEALSSTLGKAMGSGLVPGLLVGAGAGAGGMLLANRIHNGTWFGDGHPHPGGPAVPEKALGPADKSAGAGPVIAAGPDGEGAPGASQPAEGGDNKKADVGGGAPGGSPGAGGPLVGGASGSW